MFSKKKETPEINAEQRALYEHARKRIVQKKRLFQHFVVFLVGGVFFIVLNELLGLGSEITFLGWDWFVIAILIWSFFLLLHAGNVWIFSTFMGKKWTDAQMERLISKQKDRIAKLQKEVEVSHPVSAVDRTVDQSVI